LDVLRSLGVGGRRVPHASFGWSTPLHLFNDKYSTTLPLPSARLVLFDANNFRGRNIGITSNTPNLERRRFSDIASTARSRGGVWELCSEPKCGGTCVSTDTDLDLNAAGVDNTIASVRLVRP